MNNALKPGAQSLDLSKIKSADQLAQLLQPFFLSSSLGTAPNAQGGSGGRTTVLTTKSTYTRTVNGQSGDVTVATGGGIVPTTPLLFNASPAGSAFQPYSGASAAKYFTSTTTLPGGIGKYIHIMGLVTVSNAATAGYFGFGVGNTGGTRMVFIGFQGQSSNGPAVIYDTLLAGSGTVLNGYVNVGGPGAFFATGTAARFDLHVVVNSATDIVVGGDVNGVGCGLGALNDIDLTGSLTFYAVGAASTDAVVQYTTTVY